MSHLPSPLSPSLPPLPPLALPCSNHERGANTHVMRFLERHGIPYHHVDTAGSADKGESGILELVGNGSTDFLVLARYMQVHPPHTPCHHTPRPSFQPLLVPPCKTPKLVGQEPSLPDCAVPYITGAQ